MNASLFAAVLLLGVCAQVHGSAVVYPPFCDPPNPPGPPSKLCPPLEECRAPRIQPKKPSAESCRKLPNEIYIDGGPDCQMVCETMFECCTIRHILPVKDCYCLPGYARNKQGHCIPVATAECLRLADVWALLDSEDL